MNKYLITDICEYIGIYAHNSNYSKVRKEYHSIFKLFCEVSIDEPGAFVPQPYIYFEKGDMSYDNVDVYLSTYGFEHTRILNGLGLHISGEDSYIFNFVKNRVASNNGFVPIPSNYHAFTYPDKESLLRVI